ncbi:bacteriophage-like DNA-binding-containing protein [Synechococcus sp. A18-40]|nr:bacteriophage-like DNA-binding-containing protein [Synechococcus sp. A18-40]
MSWVLVALSSGSAAAALWWALKMKGRIKQMNNKYSPIIEIDKYVSTETSLLQARIESAEKDINAAKKELDADKLKHTNLIASLEKDIKELNESSDIASRELKQLEDKLELAQAKTSLMNCGYYEPEYNFDIQGNWTRALDDINMEIKNMIDILNVLEPDMYSEAECAGVLNTVILMGFDREKGMKMQKASIKLLLRAFNGECSAFVAKVNYKNIDSMIKRIETSFSAINKIGISSNMVRLSPVYKELRIKEIKAVYEYEEWKQRDKEEQARIREQIREEERAAKELEKAKRDAEKETRRNADALAKARSEVAGANEKQKTKLLAQIAELEKRMQEMEEKNRYISQAMLTKSGHVYIISNVGSFGDKMLKIGMTRRLEPMDRVKELGDASVPFPFDVHAMIRTSDAPTLENALHKHFDARRVNLENTRKEFFYVSIEEIQSELEVLKDELNIEADIHLTMAAEAKQWRMSEAKRQHLERSYES